MSTDPRIDNTADDALTNAAENFDSLMQLGLSAEDYKKIKIIGSFLSQGLSLEECCVLAMIDYDRFKIILDDQAPVRSFIRFKEVAYKARLLKVMTLSAIDGKQVKSAGYLLENKFRDEFGKKANNENDRPMDILEAAIDFVRDNGDSQAIVKPQVLPAARESLQDKS